MPKIEFVTDMFCLDADADHSILAAALRAGIPHAHSCGGNGRCTTCRVLIVEGLENCLAPNEKEQSIAKRMGFTPQVRLACQTKAKGDVILRRLVMDDVDSSLASRKTQDAFGQVGEEQLVSILFADIRGFTAFSEDLPPYDVVHVLNRYFNQVGEVIKKHGGKIYNYMGDGLMALFGVNQSKCCLLDAVKAGVEMLGEVDKLKDYLREFYFKKFDIGVGIHYGNIIIGEIGAPDSKKITAIGDAVNFASRIESLNKKAGSRLLISEAAYHVVKDYVEAIPKLSEIAVSGKSGAHTVYEVTSVTQEEVLLHP